MSEEIKRDYVKPSPEELQKQLDEKMKKFLAKGGKIEKCEPMKPTRARHNGRPELKEPDDSKPKPLPVMIQKG